MIFFESGKSLFLLSTGISFLIMAVVWIAFARISMARIEKTMVQDGLNRPCPWDGLGGRAVWYAFAVGLPVGPLNPRNDPLIDVPLVREYARPLDRRLGLALVVSSLSFLLIGLSGKFVFGFY